MSLHDQKNFIKEIHPFETLTEFELDKALKSMDIAYYPKDTVLISPEKISDYFFIIIKGEVNEYNNDELTFVYHEQDGFDSCSLIYNLSIKLEFTTFPLNHFEVNSSATFGSKSLQEKIFTYTAPIRSKV